MPPGNCVFWGFVWGGKLPQLRVNLLGKPACLVNVVERKPVVDLALQTKHKLPKPHKMARHKTRSKMPIPTI